MSENLKKALENGVLDDVAGGCAESIGHIEDNRMNIVCTLKNVDALGSCAATCPVCGVKGDMYANMRDISTGVYTDVKCYTCGALFPQLDVNTLT